MTIELKPLEIEDTLVQLDFINNNEEGKQKRILIIGSVALLLHGVFAREYTEDIDGFLLLLKPTRLQNVKKVTKGNMSNIIFSHGNDMIKEFLISISSDFVRVRENDFDNLKIFVPPLEAMVAMKIRAFNYNDNRIKDIVDITSEKLLSKVDVEAVKNYLAVWSNLENEEHRLEDGAMELYERWKNGELKELIK